MEIENVIEKSKPFHQGQLSRNAYVRKQKSDLISAMATNDLTFTKPNPWSSFRRWQNLCHYEVFLIFYTAVFVALPLLSF